MQPESAGLGGCENRDRHMMSLQNLPNAEGDYVSGRIDGERRQDVKMVSDGSSGITA